MSCRYSDYPKGHVGESQLLCAKRLFKARKLSIRIGKPQLDPFWFYASVPLLVGQNTGEMEGRKRKYNMSWNSYISSQVVLRLFFFPFAPFPTWLHSEKHVTPEHGGSAHCAQPDAVWHHNKKNNKKSLQPHKHQSTKVTGAGKHSYCKEIGIMVSFEQSLWGLQQAQCPLCNAYNPRSIFSLCLPFFSVIWWDMSKEAAEKWDNWTIFIHQLPVRPFWFSVDAANIY